MHTSSNTMKSHWLSTTAVAALLALPLAALAQVPPPDEAVLPAQGGTATPPGAVNCFDYYRFGSVQVHLTAPVSSAVSGSSITFSGEITNDNPYPIVDGSLYVRVFKSRGSTIDGNGPDVVAQFLVKSGIAIPANGSAPVSFSWKVPSYAESGDYSLATFFTTSRKFNLLGLSFTDDVVGNTVPFSVSGDVKSSIAACTIRVRAR
jgi:hypothetical protein